VKGVDSQLGLKQKNMVQDASSLHNQCVVHKIKGIACKRMRSFFERETGRKRIRITASVKGIIDPGRDREK
jgi:hypothetical protein